MYTSICMNIYNYILENLRHMGYSIKSMQDASSVSYRFHSQRCCISSSISINIAIDLVNGDLFEIKHSEELDLLRDH